MKRIEPFDPDITYLVIIDMGTQDIVTGETTRNIRDGSNKDLDGPSYRGDPCEPDGTGETSRNGSTWRASTASPSTTSGRTTHDRGLQKRIVVTGDPLGESTPSDLPPPWEQEIRTDSPSRYRSFLHSDVSKSDTRYPRITQWIETKRIVILPLLLWVERLDYCTKP